MRDLTGGSEKELVARLVAGDEMAFSMLVDELHGPLLALARTFTSSPALAEDVVQETWLAVIRGLPRFEGRSAIRTWIYGILVRRARTIAVKDARQHTGEVNGRPANGPEWKPGSGRRGLWEKAPVPWALEDPAAIHEAEEALEVVARALEALPESQQRVVRLRDVEGLPAQDVCNILHVSETNQRVLLHRGRAAIRRALDRYVREGRAVRAIGTAIGVAGAILGGGS